MTEAAEAGRGREGGLDSYLDYLLLDYPGAVRF